MLDQGLKGVQYGNAPALNSGATQKALGQYAQGMAGNALQGYEGLLQNMSSQGLQGAAALGQLGTSANQQYANNLFGGANAGAGATLMGQNALNGAIGGITSGITQGLSSFGGAPNASSFSLSPADMQAVGMTANPMLGNINLNTMNQIPSNVMQTIPQVNMTAPIIQGL